MFGYLESVSAKGVKGWAADKKKPGRSVKLRILIGKIVVAEGETDHPRHDVDSALSIKAGNYGYSLAIDIPSDKLGSVTVEAYDGAKWRPLKQIPGAASPKKKPSRSYQSFEAKGSSDSHEKLRRLRLYDMTAGRDKITPLKGKKVLDIGCNEGFFCVEAIKQGASRVLGIDYSQHYIELAKVRCPEAEFRKASWWEIPDEKFDVIFFLSAIHYEVDQKRLLAKLREHLTPDGVLVLECGVAPGDGQGSWKTIVRWDAERKYPYRDYLVNELLAGYATRLIGASVAQSGDPIPRFVFHCRPKRPTAIIVGATSYSGKTTLVREMKGAGFPIYETDMTLTRLIFDPLLRDKPISQKLYKEFAALEPVDLGRVALFVRESDFIDEFTDHVIGELPLEAETFFIEGDILRHVNIMSNLSEKLKGRNIRVWQMSPT